MRPLVVMIAAAAVCLASPAARSNHARDARSEPRLPATGRQAPFFSGWAMDGQPSNRDLLLRDLRSQNGRGLLLVFFATWCKPCRAGLERLARESDRLEREGLRVVLVNVGEDEATLRPFLDRMNLQSFRLLRDPFARQAAIPCGAAEPLPDSPDGYTARIPLAVLLDPDGVVRGVFPEEDDTFLDRVRSALPPPSVSQSSP